MGDGKDGRRAAGRTLRTRPGTRQSKNPERLIESARPVRDSRRAPEKRARQTATDEREAGPWQAGHTHLLDMLKLPPKWV